MARQVGEEVRKRKRLGFHLVGFINAPPARNNPSAGGVGDVLGDPAQMDRIIEQHDVDKIVVAITERRGEYPVKEMLALRVNGCQVVEWPGFFEKLSGRIPIDSLAPSFFIFNEGFRKSRILLYDPPGRQRDRRRRTPGSPACRSFSSSRSSSSSIPPAPSSTPRSGWGRTNKPIRIYKFRSMRNDAEKNGDAVWAVENDPRITRVGHFLRKTRIDELPQLFNVLIGELDFVGPRPERPEFVEKLQALIPYYALRHTVKPGITGWAQVMFHYGSTIDESKEKLQYDLFYIKNMSLKLDLLILFHTFKIVLLGRGAR